MQNIRRLAWATSCSFFLRYFYGAVVNGAIHACVRACVMLLFVHHMWISSVYATKGSFTRHKDRASLLLLCPVRAFLRSCAREFTSCVLLARKRSILILVQFTVDRRWCIVSYVSIGIFSLPHASIPSSARPSFPLAPPFPPPSSPLRHTLSFFLRFSFALSL